MMMGAFDRTALLAQVAGVWEATARKPGNVHPGAAFADVEFTDFVVASGVLGHVLARWPRGPNFAPSVGRAVMLGGGHSRYWVGSNTNLGIALLRSGRPEEAIEAFAATLRLRPDRLDARYELGVALLQTGRIEEGAAQLEQVLRADPHHARARQALERLRR